MSRHSGISIAAICGVSVSLAVVLLNAYLRDHFGIDGMLFWVSLVIPIGAISLGLLASSGFVMGARFSNYPARRALLALMIMTAISSFILLHIIEYFLDSFQGVPVRELVGMDEYLKMSFTQSSIHFRHQGAGESYNLGKAGFLVPFGNAVGFIGGMVSGFGILRRMRHCKKCGTYFETLSSRNIKHSDLHSFERFLQNLPKQPVMRLQILQNYESDFSPAISKKGMITFSFSHKQCPSCKDQFVTESGSVYTGKDLLLINSVGRTYKVIRTTNIPMPSPPHTTVASRPGFGRRTL